MACTTRKHSQLLCSTHQPKGSSEGRLRSKAQPSKGDFQQPEQPDTPYIPLSPKQRQATTPKTLQGSPAEPPAPAGRERGCGTRADYSTQQAPLGRGRRCCRADAEPPEPILGTRKNVNKHGGLRDTWYRRQGGTLAINPAKGPVTRPGPQPLTQQHCCSISAFASCRFCNSIRERQRKLVPLPSRI